jgi:putative acetyltransferase
MEIRPETPDDIAAIRALVTAAFPGPDEAGLVDALRAAGDAAISLVAIIDGEVCGHVLFSPMRSPARTLGLAPVATAEAHRRRGVAAALIEEGLNQARSQGWLGVFVLGDAYYQRFGFDPALAAGFASPFAGPHLMGLALQPQGLPVRGGRLDYAQAFDDLG